MSLKVTLKNFMGYELESLEFDGFTAIVGESSRGKSKVFRALKTLLENRPVEDSVTWGESSCEIAIDWPERGMKVTLKKTKTGQAKYTVEDADGRRELAKIGRAIPDPVRALGLDRLELPNGHRVDLHFHSQHDPLLVSETSIVDVMYILSCAGELLKLDKAAKLCQRDQKELQVELDGVEAQAAGIKERILALDPVTRMSPAIQSLQKAAARARSIEEELAKVDAYRERAQLIRGALGRLSARHAVLEAADLEGRESSVGRAGLAVMECRGISRSITSCREYTARLQELRRAGKVFESGQLDTREVSAQRASVLLLECRKVRSLASETRRLSTTLKKSAVLAEILFRAKPEEREQGLERAALLAGERLKIRSARARLRDLESGLKKGGQLSKIEPSLGAAQEGLKLAEKLQQDRAQIRHARTRSQEFRRAIQGFTEKLGATETGLAEAEEQLRSLCKNLKVCPVCEGNLDADRLVHGHPSGGSPAAR